MNLRNSKCTQPPGRHRALAAAALALAVTAALPVATAHAKPKADSLSEAESVAETAARRFKEGDFELAAKLFDRAYELAKKPTLLFNAGRAYEQAGQREEALARYEAYVQVETDPGGREEAKLRAARLRDQLAKDGKVTQPVASNPDSAKTEPAKSEPAKPDAPKPEPAKTDPGQAAADATDGKKGPPPAQAAEPSRTGPWIAVGTSAAVALAGAVTWGLAIKADHALQDAVDTKNAAGQTNGITQVDAMGDRDGINKRKATGVVLMSVGGAGLVGSVAWLLLSGPSTSASWLVAPAPDGLALVGRF
ncbi:MAG: hypothetical protein HY902_07215 [Deltaproteobacteria bacterium]|nr:hypothetical protein [Deltaproteobacteria bacterium]